MESLLIKTFRSYVAFEKKVIPNSKILQTYLKSLKFVRQGFFSPLFSCKFDNQFRHNCHTYMQVRLLVFDSYPVCLNRLDAPSKHTSHKLFSIIQSNHLKTVSFHVLIKMTSYLCKLLRSSSKMTDSNSIVRALQFKFLPWRATPSTELQLLQGSTFQPQNFRSTKDEFSSSSSCNGPHVRSHSAQGKTSAQRTYSCVRCRV